MPPNQQGDRHRTPETAGSGEHERSEERRLEEPVRRSPRLSALKAIRSASSQLQELLGRPPESVSSVRPADGGWEADVEVLELERIPETSSVMASYRVTLDADGELVAYEKIRRYTRGEIDRPG